MKYGAATQIVVTEWNTKEQKIQVINRVEIPKGEFTLDNATKKVIELNKLYRPEGIYIDRGFGEYQIEILRKYGMKHPESGLQKVIRPVSFSESIELIDPYTKTRDKKPIKPFMVNQLQVLFERDKVMISEYDEMIIQQLENYRVIKKTVNGQPVFTTDDDHALDCMFLCVLGYVEKHPNLMNTIVEYLPATMAYDIKTKVKNVLADNAALTRDKSYLEDDWDEPGSRPPQRVEVLPSKSNKSFGWATRGTNLRTNHKRKTW